MEFWCEEFSPETFLEQTAQTFLAALNGRSEARGRQAERDLTLAYNTGKFAQASKVRPLRYYLSQLRGSDTASSALGFFRSLQARGVPVSITRVRSQ